MKRNMSLLETVDNAINEEQEEPKRLRCISPSAPPANESEALPGPSGEIEWAAHDSVPSCSSSGIEQDIGVPLQNSDVCVAPAVNWREAKFAVLTLNGHSDIVSDVALDGDLLLSASHDTTLRVWDLASLQEMHCLGGHKERLTGVVLLDTPTSDELCQILKLVPDRLAISSSLDCCIKVWRVLEGTEIKSIYTYNGITCLGYMTGQKVIVIGTQGGKVELYDIVTDNRLQSLLISTEHMAVTALAVEEPRFVTACHSNSIQVWEVQNRHMRNVFEDKSVINDGTSKPSSINYVKSLHLHGQFIYITSASRNLIILNWKTERFKYFRNCVSRNNHVSSVVSRTRDLLLGSSYNIKSGFSSVSIQHIPSNTYLCSLNDASRNRIWRMAAVRTRDMFRFVMGGEELNVCELILAHTPKRRLKNSNGGVILAAYIPSMAEPAEDSVDGNVSESDNEGGTQNRAAYQYRKTGSKGGNFSRSGWRQCAIL